MFGQRLFKLRISVLELRVLYRKLLAVIFVLSFPEGKDFDTVGSENRLEGGTIITSGLNAWFFLCTVVVRG